jgi:hypothetical protein
MEYFDDDMLINDYMEDDDFEPPPQEDFPEDFIMEQEVVQAVPKASPTGVSNPSALKATVPIDASIKKIPQNDAPPAEINVQNVPSRRRDGDLYSFER